jgi:hypothetical protein
MNGVGTLSILGVRGQSGMPPDGEYYPHVFVMPSGRTLVAGPGANDSWAVNPIGTPPAFSWSDIPGDGWRFWGTGVLMPGGTSGSTKVMLINGSDNVVTTTTAVYDEANPGQGWKAASPTQIARGHHNTVLLPDGSMVTVGGGVGTREPEGQFAFDPEDRQVELWDPATGTWKLGAEQLEGRAYHSTALLIPDGRVVSAGDDYNGAGGKDTGWNTDTAEFYSPPYLFKGPRPTITDAPAGVPYATQFAVDTPDTDVTKASMVALGATTHANDMHQRAIRLRQTGKGSSLNVTLPAQPGVVPPGYYMLFAVNGKGVPSLARFVRVI